MSTLIVVIYDGIENSIFQSQVITPLLIRKAKNPLLNIKIVSFEPNAHIRPPHIPDITFHIFKRYPFVHCLSLIPHMMRLRFLLYKFASYEILARGPFAGYIAYKAATKKCTHITIQARGLVAEEYRYTYGATSLSRLQHYRYQSFLTLEKTVYILKSLLITFQAVSPALKEYMIQTFNAPEEQITIAEEDVPHLISLQQKKAFRAAIRTQLHIDENSTVYCYSGSYKPWQCPHETIEYFKKQYLKNNHIFLLILTPDVQSFKNALEHLSLPQNAYHLCNVSQQHLFKYLAAADIGLLFREKHIINFVSRPTKAIEYQAARLMILHNNTVAYLQTDSLQH